MYVTLTILLGCVCLYLYGEARRLREEAMDREAARVRRAVQAARDAYVGPR